MPTTPPQIDPEVPLREAEDAAPAPETVDASAPLTFVPHIGEGAKPVRIRTGRYGELEEHELLHLLDSIEDELARRRFRESLYISFITCVVLALVVLYGPKYLWHAPELVNPADVLKNRELVQLNAPVLPHSMNKSTLKPTAKPTLDNKMLEKLRSMNPPAPPAPAPAPAMPAPAAPAPVASSPAPPLPAAPAPQPSRAPLAEAPTPQPTTKPNFSTPGTASDAMKSLLNSHNRAGATGSHDTMPTGKGGNVGAGVDVLSDMQGVDFSEYIRRVRMELYRNWIPLLPEETEPPLSKQGETIIRFKILPNGQIGNMVLEGRSGDVAIDKAAWGSIVSEGQFAPLPKQFHGDNLELRFYFSVNREVR